MEEENFDLSEIKKQNEEQISKEITYNLTLRNTEGLNDILSSHSSSTITSAIENVDDFDILSFYSLSSDYKKLGELFSYLPIEMRKIITINLPKKVLVNIFSNVMDDDLADFIEDLTKSEREKILNILPSKRKKQIALLTRFSDDTIGSLMTGEYLSVKPTDTISSVFKKIKDVGSTMESVRTIFVTDSTNHLLGIKSLEEMMFDDPDSCICDNMEKDYPSLSPIADRENAIEIFKKYDLPILPVTSKNNDMLGIVTFDDVLDIIEKENTEDVYMQSGITPSDEEHHQSKFYKIAMSYVIWLVILLIINTFASLIVDRFETELMTLPVLVAFLPVLNDTGGNSGDQTTSIVTRALATGEIKTRDYFKVLLKESLAGFLTGIVIFLIALGWTMVELNTSIINVKDTLDKFISDVGGNRQYAYFIISLVIASSLFFAVFVSKILGASLPMLAKLCHIDPAVISGPLITSVMDILTLLIYFTLARFIINHFDPGEMASMIAVLGAFRV